MAEHPAYPVGLRLTGRRVVVLGGGQVAQRRLPALIAAGADVLLVSPVRHPLRGGHGGRRRDPLGARAATQDGDLADAWYALIATGDRRGQRAGLRRGRAPPRLVRPLRRRRRRHRLDPGHRPQRGRHGRRAHQSQGRDPRRSAAVRDAVVEGLRDGTLAAPHHRTRTPGVALVGGGPGDPDLITVRGRRLLAEADVVIADRLGPRDLLDELPPHVEVIDAAKIPYGRFMAQEAINNALIEHAKAGQVRRPAQGRRPVRLRPRHGGAPGPRRGRHPLHRRPRHLQLDLGARRRRHPGHPPRRRPRVHRGQRPCRPRRRALPGRLAVPRQAHAAPW